MSTNILIIQQGIFWVHKFEDDNEKMMECFCTMTTLRDLMVMVYNALVQQKEIDKIELLPVEDKNQLWVEANEIANGRLDNKNLIKMSKVLYVLKRL